MPLKYGAPYRLAIMLLVQQRRLMNLRDAIPEIFHQLAPIICDQLIALPTSTQRVSQGVSTWQLRSLARDILLSWKDPDIDWLLAGGTQSDLKADPTTNLRFNDPKQLLDYNKVIIGVNQMEVIICHTPAACIACRSYLQRRFLSTAGT